MSMTIDELMQDYPKAAEEIKAKGNWVEDVPDELQIGTVPITLIDVPGTIISCAAPP